MRAALYILAAAALYYAGGFYDVGALLVAAVAMALLGVILYELFDVAERRLTRWRRV